MELPVKIVNCIQPLTTFAKQFILGISQGYEYASYEAKQNPGALSLIPQKTSTIISSTFKFNFIFTLPCGETLLITNSIHTIKLIHPCI